MIVAEENVLDAGDQVALHRRPHRRRWRRNRQRRMRSVEQRLRRVLACSDQHDLAGRPVGRGQHGRVVHEVAQEFAAGKSVAHDDAVAVRHDLGGPRRTGLAIRTGHAGMHAHIGGNRCRGGRDLRRIGQILLRVEDLRPG